jgi:hypothetical protein
MAARGQAEGARRLTGQPMNRAAVEGKWIRFVDEGIPSGLKTHIFRVEAKVDFVEGADAAPILGTVKWFGRWRCYAFFPSQQTVYEKTCLREIADFCQDMTAAHAAQRSRKVAAA